MIAAVAVIDSQRNSSQWPAVVTAKFSKLAVLVAVGWNEDDGSGDDDGDDGGVVDLAVTTGLHISAENVHCQNNQSMVTTTAEL